MQMLSTTRDGVLIAVRVIPRSGRSEIAGTRDGDLLVRLKAAPVDGGANAELIDLIARALDVPKRAVAIATGERSRRKVVRVSDATLDDIQARLAQAGAGR